jgi:hypothetical protein
MRLVAGRQTPTVSAPEVLPNPPLISLKNLLWQWLQSPL